MCLLADYLYLLCLSIIYSVNGFIYSNKRIPHDALTKVNAM
jgi:hypothetical protein